MTDQSAALATRPGGSLSITREVFGDERIEVLKEQLGRGWKEPMTDAELEHIALVCQETRLNPLVKPPLIYFIKRYDARLSKEVMTPQVSIDGLRLIAQRSRDYAGQVGPLWTADGRDWTEVWLSDDPPVAAKVGVLRRGFRDPIWSVATWKEWAQYVDEYRGNQKTGNKVLAPFWKAKGAHMLGKTAEGMSIKRAFAQETNKLELAALHEEFLAEAPAKAALFDRIYGADEDHAFAELPQPRTVETPEGRVVDGESGEVLEEHVSQEPPEPAAPSRNDIWAENRRLVARAAELGVSGVAVLNNRSATDVLVEANATLAERILNAEQDQQAAREAAQSQF